MKKKLLATLLSVSMVMGLAACGSSTADSPAPGADPTLPAHRLVQPRGAGPPGP